MTADLERRYRRLLRLYPKQWRRSHGEALLGVVLDEAEHDLRTTIPVAQIGAFAAAGVSARLDRIVMPPVRDAASTVALCIGAGGAVVAFLVSSWAPWGVRNPFDQTLPMIGPFHDFGPALTALWVTALIAALIGRWTIGRAASVAAALASIAMPFAADALGAPSLTYDRATLIYSAVTALIAAAGTPRTRLPLIAAAAGFALITWTCFSYERPVGQLQWQPTLMLWDRLVWPWYATALVITVATLLAAARLWTASFTALLSLVPMTATFDLEALRGEFHENGNPWILTAPIIAGLIALALASSGALTLPTWQRHSRRLPDARG